MMEEDATVVCGIAGIAVMRGVEATASNPLTKSALATSGLV